jgi:DNA (cytosine-5)-methyltransferase 1
MGSNWDLVDVDMEDLILVKTQQMIPGENTFLTQHQQAKRIPVIIIDDWPTKFCPARITVPVVVPEETTDEGCCFETKPSTCGSLPDAVPLPVNATKAEEVVMADKDFQPPADKIVTDAPAEETPMIVMEETSGYAIPIEPVVSYKDESPSKSVLPGLGLKIEEMAATPVEIKNMEVVEEISNEALPIKSEKLSKDISLGADLKIEDLVPIDITRLSPMDLHQMSLPSPASPLQPIQIPSHRHGNHLYRAGKSAELKDGTFLRIKSLILDRQNNTVYLRGDLLSRFTREGTMLPRRRNELLWLCTTSNPAVIFPESEALQVTRPLQDALRVRKVNFTNHRHEDLNTATHANAVRNSRDDLEIGELFCRVRRMQIAKSGNRVLEDSIRNLTADEADPPYRVAEAVLRHGWRGSRVLPGGGYENEQEVFALDGTHESVRVQRYTLGDAFCGGGGITRGALLAGLHPIFGFDCNEDAIETYRANFEAKGTLALLESVDVFLSRVTQLPFQERLLYMVDILHISPPCQYFSPAHTVANDEKDAENEAVIFSVQQLLQTLKPRIVTVEETFGLLRHFQHLSALVNIFVSIGYSVRWKICNLANWGVPQQRKRLLFIAAGPGERLPSFPKATHGAGLKKPVTIQETLDRIPVCATRQEISTGGIWPKMPFSPDTLSMTLTCNGGQGNYHPSGSRAYTIREIASLQTFPWYHIFPGKSVTVARRQIGNAVPPAMGRAIYREVIRGLRETDGEENGDVEM